MLHSARFRQSGLRRLSHKSVVCVANRQLRWQRVLRRKGLGAAAGELGTVMPHRAPLRPLVLTDEEQRQLQQWRRLPRANHLALRARIVLEARLPRTNCEIASRLGVSAQTVGKWRARFALRGLPGLKDEPRCGAPRSISDDLVEAVLAKTLHERPPHAARWSSRQLASALGISQRAVLRIWHAFDL